MPAAAMKPYVIGQGESAVTLSIRRCFDLDAVWNHPKNAKLKTLRADPHVLSSGDILYIPDRDPKWVAVSVGGPNKFTAKVPALHVSIGCQGPDGKALANASYVIDEVTPPIKGATDGGGVATFSFPSTRQSVRLRFPDLKFVMVAKIAHLDPVTEPSGVAQRLIALGLMKAAPPVGSPSAQEIVAAEYLAEGLRAFQKQQGLPETGEIDDATAEALAKAHGA